jgi:hypothetical protein
VTAFRLLAQVVHVNDDPLGIARTWLSRVYQGCGKPRFLRGSIGPCFHHVDSIVFHRQPFATHNHSVA